MSCEESLKDALAIIQVLALETASELELHYEKEEFYALGATISNLELARDFMEVHRISVPDVVTGVISIYHQGMN